MTEVNHGDDLQRLAGLLRARNANEVAITQVTAGLLNLAMSVSTSRAGYLMSSWSNRLSMRAVMAVSGPARSLENPST